MSFSQLKEAIIRANPKIETRNTSVEIPKPFGGLINYKDTTIRLTDVLLAISVVGNYYIEMQYNRLSPFILKIFFRNNSMGNNVIMMKWNLFYDNIDHQSDELKTFLSSILVK